MSTKNLLGTFVLAPITLALTGCANITGGGSIPAANDPTQKAIFGFVMHCRDTAAGAVVTGNLEYQDRTFARTGPDGQQAELRIHAEPIDAPFDGTCADSDTTFPGFMALTTGLYVPQPRTLGPGGTFVLLVEDNGQEGPGKVDKYSILLTGGIFDGYSNSGTLIGGQITKH